MTLYSIASGSSGNSIYVGNNETGILIDAGVSAKRIEEGLNKIGISGDKISAVLITHEHIDHVRGLEVFCKKYHTPVFGTKETLLVLSQASAKGKAAESLFHYVQPGISFDIQNIHITPFSISHDAQNPVCYSLSSEGKKIGMATDLGKYDNTVVEMLSGSDILYLEANYDLNMLMAGSYPYQTKRRIAGERGHLSNELSSELISKVMNKRLKYIILAHMSKENNYAELAHETIRQTVCAEWKWENNMPDIWIANRDIPTEPAVVE
jgi:phosphoribosyl 1,2-cyclic phosphodiesterase